MKKNALMLGLALLLTACSSEQASQPAEPTKSETPAANTAQPANPAPANANAKQAEHFAAGTDATMPPFIYKDEQGQIIGFDIDVLKAIGEDQGFSFDLITDSRSKLFDELGENRYQILVANLGINPERLSKSEMSKPYVWAPNVIMGKEGSTAKTLADIGDAKVAVQTGSHSHDSLTRAGVKNVVTTDSLYLAYAELMRGNVDYVVGDAGALSQFHLTSTSPNKPKVYTAIYDPTEDVSVGFAVQKGNMALIQKINAGLANIRSNGKYDQIYKKWFGDDNSLLVPANKLR